MKLAINLALLLTSTLALASTGEAPHRLDRSSVSRTQEKKDLLTAPMMGGGGRRIPCGRGRVREAGGGGRPRGGSWLERFGWGNAPVHAEGDKAQTGQHEEGERGRRVPVDLIFVIPVQELGQEEPKHDQLESGVHVLGDHVHPAHHHPHHRHGGFRAGGGRTLTDRLDRAINQLEPIEAGILSFIFGFGFMSLFGMLFAITGRLIHRKRACRSRRAAARAVGEADQAVAPPAYIAALAAEEKVALLVDPTPAEEQQ